MKQKLSKNELITQAYANKFKAQEKQVLFTHLNKRQLEQIQWTLKFIQICL